MPRFAVPDLPVHRFFFLRHGQSQGNVAGLFHANSLDWPLTDVGQDQARRAALVLETQPVRALLSSPLLRVQQTLTPYVQGTGAALPHKRDQRLIERDFAGVAGKKIPSEGNFFMQDPAGVEPARAFIARVFAGLHAGLTQEDTLLAAHAGVLHALTLGLGLDLDPWVGPYNNAVPTSIERRGQGWTVDYWDFASGAWTRPPPASRDWTRPDPPSTAATAASTPLL